MYCVNPLSTLLNSETVKIVFILPPKRKRKVKIIVKKNFTTFTFTKKNVHKNSFLKMENLQVERKICNSSKERCQRCIKALFIHENFQFWASSKKSTQKYECSFGRANFAGKRWRIF